MKSFGTTARMNPSTVARCFTICINYKNLKGLEEEHQQHGYA